MPGRAIILASVLSCCACEGPKSPASEPAKQPAKQPAEQAPPKLVSEAEGPAPASQVPAWFDLEKIEHHAVIQQMSSTGSVAGGQVSAMVLELEPGVSSEQCIERAKAALRESLSELPDATGDASRLMLQGKTDSYHYTIVCGEAKGKPTMYLSYTEQ
jgi:hypothetical protein